jgi:hypothetical protein
MSAENSQLGVFFYQPVASAPVLVPVPVNFTSYELT